MTKTNSKKNIVTKLMIIIQLILTIALIILGIITIFKPTLLRTFEIVLGITLIDIGFNNQMIFKRKNLTILYYIIGIGSLIIGIFQILGG